MFSEPGAGSDLVGLATRAVHDHFVGKPGDVVTARLTAQQTDGTVKIFQGTYTARNGVIVGFNVRQSDADLAYLAGEPDTRPGHARPATTLRGYAHT